MKKIIKYFLDPAFIIDIRNLDIIEVNEKVILDLSFPLDRLIGEKVSNIIDLSIDDLKNHKHKKPKIYDTIIRDFNNNNIKVELSVQILDENKNYAIVSYKRLENKYLKGKTNIHRRLMGVWNVNKLIIREKNKDKLLEEICQILIDSRGYIESLIYIDEENKCKIFSSNPNKYKGIEKNINDYNKLYNQSFNNNILHMRLDDKILEKTIFYEKGTNKELWGSSLRYEDKKFGVIFLITNETISNSREEMKIFNELRQDISFALFSIEREEELRKNHEEIIKQENILEKFFQNSHIGFFFMMLDKPIDWKKYKTENEINKILEYVFDHQRMTKVNKAMLKQYHSTEEEMLGSTPRDSFENNINYGKKRWKTFFDKGYLHIETEEKRRDGTSVFIKGDYICLYDNKGRITGHFGIQEEVTEQKETKEKLEESENYLKRILDTANEGFWSINSEYKTKDVNNKMCDILGLPKEELIGKKIWDFVDSENKTILECEMDIRCNAKSSVYELELKNIKKGSVKCLFNATPLHDESKNLNGFFAMVTDITEMRETQTKAKEYLNKLEKAQQVANMGFANWNIKTKKVELSNEAVKILGLSQKKKNYDKDEILKYIHIDDEKEARENLKLAVKGKIDFDMDIRVINAKKEHLYLHTQAELVKDKEGNPVSLLGTILNITSRKDYEEEILRLYEAIDQSPIPVALLNLDGKFIYINPRYSQLSEYSREELLGKITIKDDDKYPEDFSRKIWDTLEANKVWKGEIVSIKKGGEEYLEDVTIAPVFNKNGVKTSYVKVSRDITAQRKLEDELIFAKEKAEESDRLKSAFLANVSHEIRTPLNGIQGISQILLDEIKNRSHRHYLSLLQKSADRLEETINDVLSIAKIESEEVKIEKENFSLNEMIDEIYGVYKSQVSNINIKKEVPLNNLMIKNDKQKIGNILNNLMGNAVKFTLKGEVTIGYDFDSKFVTFFIKDTGVGIPDGYQDKIFQRFRQVDLDYTRDFEGTGLGLSIVKELVKILEGEIWFESELGKGTTFFVKIPSTVSISIKNSNAYKEIPKYNTEKLKGKKVLIAEDNKINFLILEENLIESGMKTIHAANGKEAVELFKRHKDIDIILMDIKMPIMGGIEATIKIKKINSKIPIIAQTAYAMLEDKEKILLAGCDGYIIKPIKINRLLEELNKFLS
ncbi:MAG: hybrid sensor histidine kinase/response regulator [Fusobacteriota bacterium]